MVKNLILVWGALGFSALSWAVDQKGSKIVVCPDLVSTDLPVKAVAVLEGGESAGGVVATALMLKRVSDVHEQRDFRTLSELQSYLSRCCPAKDEQRRAILQALKDNQAEFSYAVGNDNLSRIRAAMGVGSNGDWRKVKHHADLNFAKHQAWSAWYQIVNSNFATVEEARWYDEQVATLERQGVQ